MEDDFRVQNLGSDTGFPPEPYRSPWRRDCARLIHSPSFRRLQGKTQLFPGTETDFFRNRLTHSLEVAQIAKSIALKLNFDLEQQGEKPFIEPDVAEFAGLAHDLGHPPFGHFGEEALDERMIDVGGFEGNAQTLRILTKTEKRHLIERTTLGINERGEDQRTGLNLTMRSIGSVLKYDNPIPPTRDDRNTGSGPVKGYYHSEANLVELLKDKLSPGETSRTPFKTVECQIMDIADDIAYSTYDLEDSFKAGFINPIDLVCASEEVLENLAKKVSLRVNTELDAKDIRGRIREVFFHVFRPPVKGISEMKLTDELYEMLHFSSIETATRLSRAYADDGYYRTDLTSKRVGLAIRGVKLKKLNHETPLFSEVEFDHERRIDVEILKNYVYESQILSQRVQIAARRGKEIVQVLFDTLSCSREKGYLLLPNDFKDIYCAISDACLKRRIVCDFIASMTDRYAIELYGRLTSENPQTIFKPL